MSAHCHNQSPPSNANPAYHTALWIALSVNAAMFAIELGAGLHAGSVSLLADAIDFLGDAANYAVSLVVLGAALRWRSRTALAKAGFMMGFGMFVAGRALWSASQGITPDAATMGAVGLLALVANVSVALLLYRFRAGDANMRSVWLCTRNDALGNLAVLAAAAGVLGTGTAWPDLAVAGVMAMLAISGGWAVMRQARAELRGENHAH